MSYPNIESFVEKVRWKFGNRTDIDARITGWLKDAYLELSGYPLETLEESTQDTTAPGQDTYSYPSNARSLKAITLVDASLVNGSPVQPRKKNIQVVRRYMIGTQGMPAVWAGFGSSYILRPTPDRAYTVYLDYWKKPALDPDEVDVTTINECLVELPDDWFEILVRLAAQKGYSDLQEQDKSMAEHQLVFGDPGQQGKAPGMIKERMTRNAAENGVSNYGIRPRIRRYTR